MAEAMPALAANGGPMQCFGKKKITFELYDGQHVSVEFVVMDVRRPLLSVGLLAARGCQLQFRMRNYLQYKGMITPIVRQGNLYYLPVKGKESHIEEILVIQLQH
eukprot:8273561-Heterocapsa_arctica.AAC.1